MARDVATDRSLATFNPASMDYRGREWSTIHREGAHGWRPYRPLSRWALGVAASLQIFMGGGAIEGA